MYRVEDEHWWYRGMASITRTMLARWYGASSSLRILDAGCGTGSAMTALLPAYGCVTGVDIHPLALQFCRKRGISRIACASILDLPFGSAEFDLVTSFDVLYEKAVDSDLAALREFARVLVPNGAATKTWSIRRSTKAKRLMPRPLPSGCLMAGNSSAPSIE